MTQGTPRRRSSKRPPAAAERQPALTVLVVDDDPAVHDVLTRNARRRKAIGCMHARDGAEALRRLRKTPPDVVTLDVMMPKVDGWSVLGGAEVRSRAGAHPGDHADHRRRPQSRLVARRLRVHDQADRSRAAGDAAAPLHATAARDAVVLIVDDDPEVRNVISATLAQCGLKTAEAANGRAALDWLDRQSAARPGPARPDDAGDGRVRSSSNTSARIPTGSRCRSSC